MGNTNSTQDTQKKNYFLDGGELIKNLDESDIENSSENESLSLLSKPNEDNASLESSNSDQEDNEDNDTNTNQVSDDKSSKENSSDADSSDAKSSKENSSDADSSDADSSDADSSDAESSDAESSDAESSDESQSLVSDKVLKKPNTLEFVEIQATPSNSDTLTIDRMSIGEIQLMNGGTNYSDVDYYYKYKKYKNKCKKLLTKLN